MTFFLSNHPPYPNLRLINLQCPPKPKPCRLTVTCAAIPARDTVIDFGKYKGRMLGTLPSTYLKWVSSNLRARDFEEWANLADQVLEDPVYNDRVEWEYADKLLNGNALTANAKSVGAVAELLDISQRFGWDNEDRSAWSRIDFQLLGTSKGGRIPRVTEKNEGRSVNLTAADSNRLEGRNAKKGSVSETRSERLERLRMKRSTPNVKKNDRFYNVGEDDGRRTSSGSSEGRETEVYNPFPGRETLLKKVLSRRKIG